MDDEIVETSDPEELEINQISKRKHWDAYSKEDVELGVGQKRARTNAHHAISPRHVMSPPACTRDNSPFRSPHSQSPEPRILSCEGSTDFDSGYHRSAKSPTSAEDDPSGWSRSTTPLRFPHSPSPIEEAPTSSSEALSLSFSNSEGNSDSLWSSQPPRPPSPNEAPSRAESPDPLGLFDDESNDSVPSTTRSASTNHTLPVNFSRLLLVPYSPSPSPSKNPSFASPPSDPESRSSKPPSILNHSPTTPIRFTEAQNLDSDHFADDEALDPTLGLFGTPISVFERPVTSPLPPSTPSRSPLPPICTSPDVSPLTPANSPPLEETSPIRTLDMLGVEPSADGIPTNAPDLDEDQQLAQALGQEGRRYSLRARQAKQLRPYAHDKISYKQQMRSNPEAIVKIVSPDKRQSHRRSNQDEEEESQEIWDLPDNELSDGEQRRRRPGHSGQPPSPKVQGPSYPGILGDFSDLEDDPAEAREAKKLAREAKRVAREQHAKERRERAARAHEAKLERERERARSAQAHVSASKKAAAKPFDWLEQDEAPKSPPAYDRQVSAEDSDGGQRDSYSATPWRSLSPLPPDEEGVRSLFDDDDIEIHPSEPLFGDGLPPVSGGDDAEINDQDDAIQEVDQLSPRSRKRLRIAGRCLPGVMLKNMEGIAPRQRPQRRSSPRSRSPEEVPLLPGQTRRRIRRAGEQREIVGDSESSQDDHGSSSDSSMASDRDSMSQAEEDLGYWGSMSSRRRNHSPSEHFAPYEASPWDAGIDDDYIQAVVADGGGRTSGGIARPRAREESQIDFMLSRSCPLRPKQPQTAQSHQPKPPIPTKHNTQTVQRYRPKEPSSSKLDLVTNGARKYGNMRQSLLSFDKSSDDSPPVHRPSSSHEGHAPFVRSVPRNPAVPRDAGGDSVRLQDVKSNQRKQSRKRRRKRRGVDPTWSTNANGQHISSGKRNSGLVTIDAEEEDGFHRALAPRWQKRLPHPPLNPPPNPASLDRTNHPPSMSQGIETAVDFEDTPDTPVLPLIRRGGSRRDISRDFGISLLGSGRVFVNTTFIRSGGLYKLLQIITGTETPPTPVEVACRGFQLNSMITVQEYCDILPRLCGDLCDAVTGLPEGDPERSYQEWSRVMQVSCQCLSWCLFKGSADEATRLRQLVNETISNIVQCLDDPTVLGKERDSLTMAVCWYGIDMMTRAGYRWSPSQTSGSQKSDCWNACVSLLIRELLAYGLQRTMEPLLLGTTTFDVAVESTTQYTAELWVYLIHLLEHCAPAGSTTPEGHLLWHFVVAAVQDASSTLPNLEASELSWRCIFSLCALSQFSVHGMTTSQSRLPPCWSFPAFALRQIRLTAGPQLDQGLSEASIAKRDEYIALVALRCYHLVSHWRWAADNAFYVLQPLADIFRSRMYANLRQEPADFPEFLRRNEVELLDTYFTSDTAYTLFLKLFAKASSSSSTDLRPLHPRAKKFLSIIMPVTQVDFTKSSPPSLHDLSKLYNRYATVAIAVLLDPPSLRNRMEQARSYVRFDVADFNTRVACIRGIMMLGKLLVLKQLAITELVPWITETVLMLVDEYDALNVGLIQQHQASGDNHHTQRLKDQVVLCIQLLLGSVRQILETYGHDLVKGYPEPLLLGSCDRIFRNGRLNASDSTALQVRLLVVIFCNLRRKIIPPPPRPPLQLHEMSSESQDEYGFAYDGLDMDDPSLLAAISEEMSDAEKQRKALEKAACEMIYTPIYSCIYRQLSNVLLHRDADKRFVSDFGDVTEIIHEWTSAWLNCAAIVVQNGKMSWSAYLDRKVDTWGKITLIPLQRWVDVRVMLTVLLLDPTCYASLPDRFLTVLLISLAAVKVTIEHEYVSLLLSIDGLQHDLLRGLVLDRPNDTADFDISRAQFGVIRASILETIVQGIELRLGQQAGVEAHLNEVCIDQLIAMFVAMDGELKGLTEGSAERQPYIVWCRKAHAIIQQSPRVSGHERLRHWVNWGRNLVADE
ncbi:hypothetical protein HGRIS_004680 [Hohenbuehelia grisea]|uniref:Uncharacterized protein n=1 Tax=Hohenbuehelia grisea TaxID=104357 RepID=A0ABR3JDA6_9AGAR